MALSNEDRAAAEALAAAMPPLTEEQRDALALLLRPAVPVRRNPKRRKAISRTA